MDGTEQIYLSDSNSRAADGAIYLVAGILRQARADYIRGKYKYRKDVERFVQSDWYLALTNMDNGTMALRCWEELRRKELGEGCIHPESGKLFLVEGMYGGNKKQIHIIVVNAKNKKEAEEKAHEYGIRDDIQGVYTVIELRGMNEKLKTKIAKSNSDVVLIKSDVLG